MSKEAREKCEREHRRVVKEWLHAIEQLDVLADRLALLGYSVDALTLVDASRSLKDNPPHDALQVIQKP